MGDWVGRYFQNTKGGIVITTGVNLTSADEVYLMISDSDGITEEFNATDDDDVFAVTSAALGTIKVIPISKAFPVPGDYVLQLQREDDDERSDASEYYLVTIEALAEETE